VFGINDLRSDEMQNTWSCCATNSYTRPRRFRKAGFIVFALRPGCGLLNSAGTEAGSLEAVAQPEGVGTGLPLKTEVPVPFCCPWWSRGVTRWFRCSLSGAGPFVCRCLTSVTMLPSSHPAHRTGRAHFAHPALGESVTRSPTGNYVSAR